MSTASQATNNEIREFIRAQIASIAGLDELTVDDDTPLFSVDGMGESEAVLDSLGAFELSLALMARFDIEIPDDLDVAAFRTVRSITEFVAAMTQAG